MKSMMWITLHIWLVNVITFVATFLTSEIKQFLFDPYREELLLATKAPLNILPYGMYELAGIRPDTKYPDKSAEQFQM